jgi:TetR/AcrR family transcriptional regulator, mexJK operon transcriptional repressor
MVATVPAPITRATATTTAADRVRSAARPKHKARRGGRPSLHEAPLLRERILEVATHLFLTQGYGSTSIDAVAAGAGVSKRTFYSRFEDKAALFAAVVHRIIAHVRPAPDVPLIEGATLHEVLTRLAGFILHAALDPTAIALHRLITAESARFPELARAVVESGGEQEASALIGDLLARRVRDPRFSSEARAFAAQQFLGMVIEQPRRRSMGLGVPMTAAELEVWADNVVRLFLNGSRG